MTRSVNESQNTGIIRYNKYKAGTNSPIIGGVMQLRDNSFKFYKTDVMLAILLEKQRTKPGGGVVIDYDKQYNLDFGVLTLQGAPKAPPYDENQLVAGLKIKLRNKLRESDFNFAVAYAEKTQTANLLKDSAERLLKAAKNVRRGNFKKAAENLGVDFKDGRPIKRLPSGEILRHPRRPSLRGTFANNWLAYSYGWSPLYNDMYGSMVACDKAIRGLPDRMHRSTVACRESFHLSSGGSYGSPSLSLGYKVENHIQNTYKLACRVRVTNPSIHTVDSSGVLNPSLTIWEKVPYSFVIDWVYPIGDWLMQMTPLLGLSVSSVFLTKVSDQSVSVTFPSPVNSKETTYKAVPPGKPIGSPQVTYTTQTSLTGIPGTKHFVYVERSVSDLAAVPYPMRPKFPDAWQQAASALSLFHTFMRKHS